MNLSELAGLAGMGTLNYKSLQTQANYPRQRFVADYATNSFICLDCGARFLSHVQHTCLKRETMGQHYGQIDSNGNYPPEIKKEKKSMLKEVSNDLKTFIREHKSILYWVFFLFIIDHFFFQGTFKEKLSEMMNKMVGKAEKKINEAIDGKT